MLSPMAPRGGVRRWVDRRPSRRLSDVFDPRTNAIGLLRIVFATTVVVSHAWPLGGFGSDPGRPGMNPGILAVDGFFALSGFLISASAARCTVPRFLWHRVLRIYPGFWAALIAVVVVFAPSASGAVSGDSWAFLLRNVSLYIGQPTIVGTVPNQQFTDNWTGPMYTLAIEFACYLLVATLASLRMLKARPLLVLLAATWISLELVASTHVVDYRLARFPLAFLVGAVLWALADRVPAGGAAAGTALLVGVAAYLTNSYALFALVGVPAFAFLVVWAGSVLPVRGVGSRHDLSYGVYLYGWPVEQLLVAWGANRIGLPAYLALALSITASCAYLSWRLVESRALRLKHVGLRPLGRARDGGEVGEGGVADGGARAAVLAEHIAPNVDLGTAV